MWTYDDLERVLEAFAGDPPDPRKARKRARILDAATALFIQHGYRKASVDEVALRASVAKGTVYLYFPRKADLLLAALLEEKKRILINFRSVLEADISGRERLRMWLLSVLESLSEMPLSARLLGGDREVLAVIDDLDQDLVQQTLDLKVGFLAPLVAEARGRECPNEGDRTTAKVLMGVFQASSFFLDERSRLGLDQRVFNRHVVDLLVDGVTADHDMPVRTAAGALR